MRPVFLTPRSPADTVRKIDVSQHDHPCRPPPRPCGAGGRRPGDLRPDCCQAAREEAPSPLQRSHPRGLRRLRGGFLRAVFPLRIEAGTVSRQPRALGGGACQGLAQRPHPAAPRGDAHRARHDVDLPAVGHRRPHRARRWDRRDRIGRALRAGGRQGAGKQYRSQRPCNCRKVDGHRGRNLHLYERGYRGGRAVVAIYLPQTTRTSAGALTPRQIVAELDKYVVGQTAAKRAVAIALRNRMRRQKLAPELAEEIAPKNILMIGPTGVGKTEIARRLARLAQSPFLKVEASKFTEVGYVGRDVESMVRDLVELGVDMVREERLEEVRVKAGQNAEDRLLDILLPPRPGAPDEEAGVAREAQQQTRERFREQLRAGRLESRVVEI